MRSTANQAANVAGSKIADMFNRHVWDHVLDLDEMIWWRSKEVDTNGNVIVPFKLGAIPLALIALTAMWLLNLLTDWAGTYGIFWPIVGGTAFFASFLIGFGGYFAIWRQVAKPRNIRFGAFVFATFNALQWKNPVRGAVTGAQTVLQLTGVIGLYYLFAALVLWTWGFSNSPMAFWVGLAAIIVLASLGAGAGIRALVMTLYASAVLIMALWSTFDDVYHGKAFDPETGATLYMVDPTTGRIDDNGRSPGDCTEETKCFSAETGQELVPMTKEQALKRSPGGIADKAIAGVSGVTASVSALGTGAVSAVTGGGSNCPKSDPCVAYDGYVLTLPANKSLTINQEQFWKAGLDIKVTDPKLRATMHDSRLFNNRQSDNSNVVTIVPVASGFAKAGVSTIELKIYPRGQGDERVKQDYGIYTPTIDLSAA